MKLIVGLGNPGKKYEHNRHNVGFMFVDYLSAHLQTITHNLPPTIFKSDKYLLSEIAELRINNNKIILVKPQTFMNKSGSAIKSCVARYMLNTTEDMAVIHDDLDIPLGKFKIQKGSGPKLHNGLESIEKVLSTKDFWRIRIGVDNRQATGYVDGETYVLQDFKEEEKNGLPDLFFKIYQNISLNFLK